MSNSLDARYERALDLSQWAPAGYPRMCRPFALRNPPDPSFNIRLIVNDDEALFWAKSEKVCINSLTLRRMAMKEVRDVKEGKVEAVRMPEELRVEDFINMNAEGTDEKDASASEEAGCEADKGSKTVMSATDASKVADKPSGSSGSPSTPHPPTMQPPTLPTEYRPPAAPSHRQNRTIITLRVRHSSCFIPIFGLLLVYLNKGEDPFPLLHKYAPHLSTFTAACRLHYLSVLYEAPKVNLLAAKHIRKCLRTRSRGGKRPCGVAMKDLLQAHGLKASEGLKEERRQICEIVKMRRNNASSGDAGATAGRQRAQQSSQPSNGTSASVGGAAASSSSEQGEQAQPTSAHAQAQPVREPTPAQNGPTGGYKRQTVRSSNVHRPLTPWSVRRFHQQQQQLRQEQQQQKKQQPDRQLHSLPPLATYISFDVTDHRTALPNASSFCEIPVSVLTDEEIEEVRKRSEGAAKAEEDWKMRGKERWLWEEEGNRWRLRGRGKEGWGSL
ncbi:MAG: hypothetical protein M1831_002529 [Alyxoria varia]|nr:MAG: hypothetical protein M1831_002529 [Alyxoria varia]